MHTIVSVNHYTLTVVNSLTQCIAIYVGEPLQVFARVHLATAAWVC